MKSKTVAQCVEYYYTWKKIMRLGRKHRTRLSEIIDDCVVSEAARVLFLRALLLPHAQVPKWLALVGDRPVPR